MDVGARQTWAQSSQVTSGASAPLDLPTDARSASPPPLFPTVAKLTRSLPQAGHVNFSFSDDTFGSSRLARTIARPVVDHDTGSRGCWRGRGARWGWCVATRGWPV